MTMKVVGMQHILILKNKEVFFRFPKQAASQITETVIRSKDEFNYCIGYLDKLHPNRELIKNYKNNKNKKNRPQERKEKN